MYTFYTLGILGLFVIDIHAPRKVYIGHAVWPGGFYLYIHGLHLVYIAHMRF